MTDDAIPTPPPEEPTTAEASVALPPRRRTRTGVAILAFAGPIVLAVVAVIALWGIGGNESAAVAVPEGTTYTYVIPAGTATKMKNNQYVADILPEFVQLSVGDSIVVENQDDATHTFGPITVRANETSSVDFINPGIYFGLCTVGTHESITIQVT